MCGASQAACCQVIHRVAAAICERQNIFICFPNTHAERRGVMEGFHEMAEFQGVIGAIDGSHVAITSPGGINVERFMNRKGYYSLNCKFVCDHQLLFTNVVARWYGSAHDARIFQESQLFVKFQNREYQGILLGDPAYTCRTFMLTPLCNPRTAAERNYTRAQRTTRGVIERAFGIWKKNPLCSKGNTSQVFGK